MSAFGRRGVRAALAKALGQAIGRALGQVLGPLFGVVLSPVVSLVFSALPAQAASLRYCDKPTKLNAQQQDRLLRLAAVVQQVLQQSDARVALVARSGMDLDWLDQRYSHAGLSLRDSAQGPWSVRQLYYACDEQRPRLFDQGLAGFVLGTENPKLGHISVLLLPEDDGQRVAEAALDKRQALSLLGSTYSANAHVYGLSYQNCNQWVAELLAHAWGGAAPEDVADGQSPAARAQAQQWLQAQGYGGHSFELGWLPLMWVAQAIPWLHTDDHPQADWDARRFRVSMPQAIAQWVQQRQPQARRVEICHREGQVVLRRDGPPLSGDCQAEAGDEQLTLE